MAVFAKQAPLIPPLVGKAVAKNTHRAIYTVIGEAERFALLADSTLVQKERRGYPAPATLHATGQMRDAFEEHVEERAPGLVVAAVGTSDPVALDHVTGTLRVPARPDVAIGAADANEANWEVFRLGARVLMTGEPRLEAIVAKYERVPSVPGELP